jgi:hypothetical protein
VYPVAHHARGGHHEERPRQLTGLPSVADHREGLDRLAQAHVVGEDAAEPVLPQEGQPLVAVELVGPEVRVEAGRHRRRRHGLQVQQTLHSAGPARALGLDDTELEQLLPQPRLVDADPQAVGGAVLQLPRLLDQPAQRHQLGPIEGEVGAAGQHQMALAARQGHDQLVERDLLAIDRDRHPEVEPIRAACGVLGGQPDHRGHLGLAEVRSITDHSQVHALGLPQRWEQVVGEGDRVHASQPQIRHE